MYINVQQLVTTTVDCKCAVNEMTTNQIYAWLYMYISYELKSRDRT